MSHTEHRVLATWTGFCASCPTEQPLLLVSHGPHGFRGWLAGAGADDRTLSYACGVCGRSEHVPATEADDLAYDASLLRWPDWLTDAPVAAPLVAQTVPLAAGDVFGMAALRLVASKPAVSFELPTPRKPVVQVATAARRVGVADLLAVA